MCACLGGRLHKHSTIDQTSFHLQCSEVRLDYVDSQQIVNSLNSQSSQDMSDAGVIT